LVLLASSEISDALVSDRMCYTVSSDCSSSSG
jgi:hypothetical protein